MATLVYGLLLVPARSQSTSEIKNKSLEDLMNIEVTSVSKKEQKLSRTASAIFVITQEDIERSGATNIPDLLRMVPGLDVAQVNSSSWAISSRGFNDQAATKLLVLIDGRSVYSPLFSGVFWDVQQVPLEDIERIEVIRGPGATVWGANAVNGVINIITKKAAETQGALLSGGGSGTYHQGMGIAQYGAKLRTDTYYRMYTQDFADGNLINLSGAADGDDDWKMYRAGFRVDGKASRRDSFTVQGDAYEGNEGEIVNTVVSIAPPMNQALVLREDIGGGDVLARWTHTPSEKSQMTLQGYFDRTNRADATYGEGRDTVDLDFQDHLQWGERQDIVWGAGYRRTSDAIRGSLRIEFTPSRLATNLYSGFVQDEIALIPDRLYFTMGTKLEHNYFSGFGVQPSGQLAWIIDERSMVWASVSRALRTPARDVGARFNELALSGPGGLPVVVASLGAAPVDETLLAREFGYRAQIGQRVSFDLATFYNTYGQLVSDEPGTPFLETNPAPAHLVEPIVGKNLIGGESHGLEAAFKWKVAGFWALSPAYSFERIHLVRAAQSLDSISVPTIEGSTPHEQAQLRSHMELGHRVNWDASAYFVGRLSGVPSYTRLDCGVTWQATRQVSLSVAGQNLLQAQHAEFNNVDQIVQSSIVRRGMYARFTWRFGTPEK